MANVEYPILVAFKSKLGNDRLIIVHNKEQDKRLRDEIADWQITATWYYGGLDTPIFEDVLGSVLDAEDADLFEEWLWEEDALSTYYYCVFLPKEWANAWENDDHSSFDEEDEKEFSEFVNDYREELTNKDEWFYIWDTKRTYFRDEPTYGKATECSILRFYKHNKKTRK